MKNSPPPTEILYVRGGISARAAFSVDPNEDPEEARADAIRRRRNERTAIRRRRQKMEALAGVGQSTVPKQIAKVAYAIGTYAGEVEVRDVDPNDENEHIIARAKQLLDRRAAGLPFGAASWKIVDRREDKA